MRILEPGHIYGLDQIDVSEDLQHKNDVVLRFVNREPGHEHRGTQTQEVLRALIDRTKHCDNCLRWAGNDLIIMHLRQALVLHEARALERKTVKGIIRPEYIETHPSDGHFAISEPPILDKYRAPDTPMAIKDSSECKHREYE